MSLIATLARMMAVRSGQAQPKATVLHRHLVERPMAFVPLTTAGEAGAPLGALVGEDRHAPRLLVVPQPRDRDLRFAFLADLAEVMLPYLERPADDVETRHDRELCLDAPQLLVPNRAGLRYVRLLGRSTRFRRAAEDSPPATPSIGPPQAYPVPARVPLLGRWLTHYGERALTPGSSLLLAMTELLSRHWATGQSAVEDQQLGTLLAWITAYSPGGTPRTPSRSSLPGNDPRTPRRDTPTQPQPTGAEAAHIAGTYPPGDDPRTPSQGTTTQPQPTGAEAAHIAETARDERGLLLCPPAGPATDPDFDNLVLAPAIDRYDAGLPGAEEEIRALVASQLMPTWQLLWHGVDLLRTLPEGERVAQRWESDRWSYTGHRDRVRAGEPPQPRRDDAVTAARKLVRRENDQVRLDAQEALDDPLVMAEARLSGAAFAGEVVVVEMAYREGRRPMPRPLVTVRTDDRPHIGPGDRVYRALGTAAQNAEVISCAPGTVILRLVNRMGGGRTPAAGSVPEVGDRLCCTTFEHSPRGPAPLPDPEDTPWTHGGPPADPTAECGPDPDPTNAEDFL